MRNTTDVNEINILEMTKIDVDDPRQMGLSVLITSDEQRLEANLGSCSAGMQLFSRPLHYT